MPLPHLLPTSLLFRLAACGDLFLFTLRLGRTSLLILLLLLLLPSSCRLTNGSPHRALGTLRLLILLPLPVIRLAPLMHGIHKLSTRGYRTPN